MPSPSYDGREDAKRHSAPAIVEGTSQDDGEARPRIFRPERLEPRVHALELAEIRTPATIARPGRTYLTPREKRTSAVRPWSQLSPLKEDFQSGSWDREHESAERNTYCSSQALPSKTRPKSKLFSSSPPSSPTRRSRRISRLSVLSHRLSRPLSFSGSVWVKDPDDLCVAFYFSDAESVLESEGPFDPPHHVFSKARKKRLVFLVSLAAMFSPLSSNIYFPALDTIANVILTLSPYDVQRQTNSFVII